MICRNFCNVFVLFIGCGILIDANRHDGLTLDPEVNMNISEIIRYYGYPCVDYSVVTDDGYILSLQRIPAGRNSSTKGAPRPPVLLQHGLLDSAHTWAINLPQQSLAFVLADSGFDVWLANSRGSTYSSRHRTRSPDKPLFWRFSYDDMASYDLPAFVNFVLAHSPSFHRLSYVGHSQGTLTAFSQFPRDPELQSRISSMVGLGPVTKVANVEAGLRVLSRFRTEMELALRILGHGRFMSNSPIMKRLGSTLCAAHGLPRLCADIIFLIAGHDLSNLNETRLPVYIAHTPAGTSVKNIVHYAQCVDSGKWSMYDYGRRGNLARYGQPSPPQYSLEGFNIPTMLVSGGHDVLADHTDVSQLAAQLGTNLRLHMKVPAYNHLDYTWAKNAYRIVYPRLITFLRAHL